MDGRQPEDVYADFLKRPRGYRLRWALWQYEGEEHEKRMKAISSRKPSIR